jgi:acyl-CoA thioesterase FadM
MGGIVHFSRFFVFMETTEHRFIESLGAGLHEVNDGIETGWPRVDAGCNYLSPARFGDRLEIRLLVARQGRSSMTYAFEFRCGERLVAQGRLTSVHCEFAAEDGMRSAPIPSALADQMTPATPEALAAAGFDSAASS